MTETVRQMYVLALERVSKTVPVIVKELPALRSLSKGSIVGGNSITDNKRGIQYLLPENVVHVFGFPQSAMALTSDYVKSAFGYSRAYSRQIALFDSDKRAPYCVYPGRYSDCVYFDLTAAYPTIYRAVGINCDYFPGKFLGIGDHCEDYPLKHHKTARSAVVSMGWSSSFNIWDGEQLNSQFKKGRNRGLQRLIWDVLNAIQQELIEAFPVYYGYTDGWIFKKQYLDLAYDIIGKWGMSAKIKHTGIANIHNLNAYQIGDHRTANFGRIDICAGQSNTEHGDLNSWLRGQIAFAMRFRACSMQGLQIPELSTTL